MLNKPWILILFALVVLSACSSSKKSDQKIIKATDSLKSQNWFKETRFEPQYFTSKVRFKYQDPEQNLNGNASVRMIKDESVWISVTVLFGIEGARILFTKDTVRFANKVEGTNAKYTYKELEGIIGTPVSLSTIQALLLGNLPFTEQPQKEVIKADSVLQQYQRARGAIKSEAVLSKSLGKLLHVLIADPARQTTSTLSFSNFKETEKGRLGVTKQVVVENAKGKLLIDLEHLRYDFPSSTPEMPW